ncbi:Gfo/Idh/MocA family protein [Kitasatospora sp. NPDC101183]|uniref:Gfo/Idh/MocA family protein n=1 Tax=Kitasatospora sp. NPDC101183 TaxID=3364100 RepID=UPI00380306AB
MAEQQIRVGILGASPDRGWAARAHVPALAALPGYRLTAVGTSRPESARAAAALFGAEHAFTDARRLAEHPEVDLVVVTVKVPAHLDLVGAALAAGKHVYCEWPLGVTTEEAVALADEARAAGVHHAIGLQGRYAPAVERARELIAAGRLGRITSVTVHATRPKGAGGRIQAWAAYTLDRSTGAGTVEVAGGHTLDAVRHLLGAESAELDHLSASLSLQAPTVTVAETGETVEATSPDHLLVNAVLTGGAVLSAHIHDGRATEPGTRVEVSGTEGDLALLSAGPQAPAGLQIGELRLLLGEGGAFREVPLPAPHPHGESTHVGRLYAALAEDIRTGARTVPDFAEAVRLHRLLDAVRSASAV